MNNETIKDQVRRLIAGIAPCYEKRPDLIKDDDYCFGFMLEVVELAIAEEREVMEKYRKACKGLPDGAIDGGWTALGMSTYTRALEDALNNIICLEPDRLANAYVIAGEALALRFHKISTEEREAFGWRDIASAPKDEVNQ